MSRIEPMGIGSQATFMTFTLGDDRYCADVRFVLEVMRPAAYTHLPGARPGILGVVSVRGKVLPVIDASVPLRGRPNADPDRGLVLILDSVHGEIGLLVDDVLDLLDHRSKAVSPPPASLHHHDTVIGMVEHNGRNVWLVDLPHLVDITIADHTTEPAAP